MVCVTAALINGEQDDNLENNKQCVTLNNEFDVLPAIYNYENSTIMLQIVSDKKQNISINLYDQLGKVLNKGDVTCNEGYNSVEINVISKQAGMYIYTVNNANEIIAGKITILN